MEYKLLPLEASDFEQFIQDILEALKRKAVAGTAIKEDGSLSRDGIVQAIITGSAFRILCDGKRSGGAVLKCQDDQCSITLLYLEPEYCSATAASAILSTIKGTYPTVGTWLGDAVPACTALQEAEDLSDAEAAALKRRPFTPMQVGIATYTLLGIGLVPALWGGFSGNNTIVVIGLVIAIIAILLRVFFHRCPHCGAYLDKSSLKYCPRCKKRIV